MKTLILSVIILGMATLKTASQSTIVHDDFETSSGKVTISFIGHGTLMFNFNGTIVHLDPWTKLADYSTLPKADLIVITHEHSDHLDTAAIQAISKPGTQIIANAAVITKIKRGTAMKNGDKTVVTGIDIEAIPAYNTTAGRDKFHPRGRDNGYVFTFGNKRFYVAGDTENTPEMAALKNIDVAFLPMNQPYTMLPGQVAEVAKAFKPKILYPYHYGDTDVTQLTGLLPLNTGIEVRVRQLK